LKKIIIILLITFSAVLNSFSQTQSLTWNVKNNFNNNIYKKSNTELIYSQNIPVYYTIKRSRYSIDEYTDLYLSFDDTGDKVDNYRYIFKKYHKSQNKSVYNNSAYFIEENERIELIGNENSFFQSGINLGSFTISFWIYPTTFSNNEIILRIGSQYYNKETDSVEDQSINAKMINGRLVWEFNNIFLNSNTQKKSITMESFSRILPEKWSHITMSYDSFTGIIRGYINGNEESIIVATEDGTLDSSILNLRYNERNRCVVIISPTFYGAIDEFFIMKKVENVIDKKYDPNGAEIISNVIDFGVGGIILENMAINANNEKNSDLICYYRYSKEPFDKNEQFSQNIKWKILNPDVLINENIRFFQWKILLLSGDNSNYTPKFNGIVVYYKNNNPPSKPIGVKLLASDNKLKIKWKMNAERDLKGYKIYYGTLSGRYFDTEANEGISPIDVGLTTEFELTGLNKNQIYYIAITAYDDEAHTNESDFSEEISERPFGNIE